MSTLMINNLSNSKDLDSKAMTNLLGGCDFCGGYKKASPGYVKFYCQPVYYQPEPCYPKQAHHPKYPPGSITIVDVF